MRQETQARLIEVSFPFQIHADEPTARSILAGEPRITSAILYRAADAWATGNADKANPIFCGDDLKREAGIDRSALSSFAFGSLLFVLGLAVGCVLTALMVML